ncbi:MAG: tRNA lysidine(34) synthetase TilS [Puniceicoccaceae bacterium]
MTRWEKCYRCFAATRPAEAIDREVLQFLKELPKEKTILIACSGGADSVYLLLTLLSLFNSEKERLVILHFNHGIRGADAEADASFVTNLASELGLKVEVGRPGKIPSSDEAALREARYSWMIGQYTNHGAGALALGHHADDLMESLLMGVMTGAGPAGLASPMPVKQFADGHVRLRPLLPLRRSDIESALKSFHMPWREDSSNMDTRYTRNWLRMNILPLLKEYMPQDILSAGQRTRQLMAEAMDAIDTNLQSLQLETRNPKSLSITPLLGQPAAIIRRGLTAWWIRHNPTFLLPKSIADQLVQAISSNTPNLALALNPDLDLVIEKETLSCRKNGSEPVAWSPVSWTELSESLALPTGATLRASTRDVNPSSPSTASYLKADPATEAWLDLDPSQPLTVRQWQAGDKYRPLGAPGRRKLQDLFTDQKLSAEQKQELPVILNQKDEIVWVPGFPPADQFKICPESKSALQLTYIQHSTAFPEDHGGKS